MISCLHSNKCDQCCSYWKFFLHRFFCLNSFALVIQQWVFIVVSFIRKKTFRKCMLRFILKYQQASSYKVVCLKACQEVFDHRLNLWQTETIQGECTNERKISRHLGIVKRSVITSLKHLAQETDVLLGSAFAATKLVKISHIK